MNTGILEHDSEGIRRKKSALDFLELQCFLIRKEQSREQEVIYCRIYSGKSLHS